MNKNERIEILMKELAEISAILNSVKETSPVSKTLVSLATEKAYYFGRNISQLLNDNEINSESFSEISHEIDKELSDDFFAEVEVENIFLQPEISDSTKISTNPNDITPWMPDSQEYLDSKPITDNLEVVKDMPQADIVLEIKKKEEIKEEIKEEKIKVVNSKKDNEDQKKAFESLFRHHPEDAMITSHDDNDIRKLLTLNDRFLFQRELFKGDVGLMNFTYDEINKLSSFIEALEYLEHNFQWDNESQVVRDFMTLVERHYTGRIL